MIRSVNSTYSAIRRVSRSAITAGPKGRTCVHTPILGTLRRSRTYRTTSHPIHINDLARRFVLIGGPRMARIEPEHASKGWSLGKRTLSHLPPRLITGAYIVNAGVSTLSAGQETAKGLHGMATAAYPFLGKLDAQT